ncbi:MAG: glycosyltransferase [Chitinophagales bacterium]|nr:glycosyltransferase [Bacteroidota bacterium]
MSTNTSSYQRKEEWQEHFEKLAPEYSNYRKRFSYFWNDNVRFINYFAHEDLSILEVGCGTGDMLSQLKGSYKVGIDFSEAMIDEAKRHYPELEFHVMDAENIQLNKKFDVIIISNVIGFFENVLDVLVPLQKLCHEHTRIIITYYNYLWEPLLRFAETIGIKKKSPLQSWLSHVDIANVLYLSGFETYRKNMRMLVPVYIPLVSWFLNKYIARLPIFKHFCLNQFVFARPMPPGANTDVSQKYSVSVVVPARNESGNIEAAVLRTPQMGKGTELIFIEGNSTDDTWETIQRIYEKYKDTHNIKIGQQTGKGKGDAVRKGYDMATGDVLMILDADLTVPPEDLPKFYHAIASDKGEFINGSRLVYPMEKNAMRFLNTLGNKFFSMAFTWLLEQPIKDSLCGTKVLLREDYIRLKKNRKFFGEFDPFGDFDLLFGAYKLNLKIIDLPIRYRERTYGDTNISRFKHGLILLRMCFYAAQKIKFW